MLRTLLVLVGLTAFMQAKTAHSATIDFESVKIRCQSFHSQSPEVYMDDFSWGMTLLEMEDTFEEIYQSGKRLHQHASYNTKAGEFFLYMDEGHRVPISKGFITSVTQQVETAIAKGYADFVFFPDMGHSHLYFPEEHWQSEYDDFEINHKTHHKLYRKMLNDPKMRPLYHLAEQLKMKDDNKVIINDPTLEFKYWNRNFVGYNDQSGRYSIEVAPETKKYNTVGHIEEHHSWSAGFAVSASKDGCFPFKDKNGQIRYFDIGLKDPRYSPGSLSQEPEL